MSQQGNRRCRKMSRVRTFCVSACHPRQRSASNRPSVPYLLPPPPPPQDVTDRRFPLAWDRAALDRAQAVCEVLEPTVAVERAAKLRRAADARTFNVTAVLEGLSDPGNVAAVLRTSEALGLGSIHVVNAQASEKKQASRSSAGAEKWLQVNRWENTRNCLERLKQDGFLLLAADARAATPLNQLEFNQPIAFVLGHEHRGVSEDVLQWTDGRVAVRMDGLVESLNVSVAAALLLGRARDVRMATSCYSDLLQEQRDVLYAEYLLKHCASRHGTEGVKSILRRRGVLEPAFARLDEATCQSRDWDTDVTTAKQ